MAIQIDAEAMHAEQRSGIQHGVHAPGAPFGEVGMADRFGASSTPVREAPGGLQHEGLLEPGTRGLRVTEIGLGQLMQVHAHRIPLEGQVAHGPVAAWTEMDGVRLEGLV